MGCILTWRTIDEYGTSSFGLVVVAGVLFTLAGPNDIAAFYPNLSISYYGSKSGKNQDGCPTVRPLNQCGYVDKLTGVIRGPAFQPGVLPFEFS